MSSLSTAGAKQLIFESFPLLMSWLKTLADVSLHISTDDINSVANTSREKLVAEKHLKNKFSYLFQDIDIFVFATS